MLQVFKGHIQQDTENLSNTDSTGVGLTLSWGDDVTYSCGYRNALIFEMLKLWVEDVQRISEMQYKELGDNRFSISMMIEAVLATKLPGVLLA